MKFRKSRLKRNLTLFDVFAICTGAMFSSGFFLLPGLAAAKAGPLVALAYLLAGLFILPAMFSTAELCTALPKAGGSYYFLDRSLGPLAGTIGGIGVYLALVLKTAFALVGIGAYLTLLFHFPIKPVALVLTLLFMVTNIIGAKETSNLQNVLVVTLLGLLAIFIGEGVFNIFSMAPDIVVAERFTPLLPFGWEGLFSTIGFVFVSYAGLTKVTSVAEEVQKPERNIPLGMMLSLGVTTFIYVAGVFIMTVVLDFDIFTMDLTPVATTAAILFRWLPDSVGVIIVVIAAVAAFASTGNAGLMAASRYPLAMARDRLVPAFLAKIEKNGTPVKSIILTALCICVVVVSLDEAGIAKLASGFQLFIFLMLNLAVIVMRESKIGSYDPGFRSPFYPWMQLFGVFSSAYLIYLIGPLALAFIIGVLVAGFLWYKFYARQHVVRHGAIFHWFARLGQSQYRALDRELWEIMREKGLREDDPFDHIVGRAKVIDLGEEKMTFEELVKKVSQYYTRYVEASPEELAEGFIKKTRIGSTPMLRGVCLPGLRLFNVTTPKMVIVRSLRGINVDLVDVHGTHSPNTIIYAFFFLVSPETDPQMHLRIMAEIAERAEEDNFMERWLSVTEHFQLKDCIMRKERSLLLPILHGTPAQQLAGKALKEIKLAPGSLVAFVRRQNVSIVPSGSTILNEDDVLVIIGETDSLKKIKKEFDLPH